MVWLVGFTGKKRVKKHKYFSILRTKLLLIYIDLKPKLGHKKCTVVLTNRVPYHYKIKEVNSVEGIQHEGGCKQMHESLPLKQIISRFIGHFK